MMENRTFLVTVAGSIIGVQLASFAWLKWTYPGLVDG